ncbi:rab-protein geranylgeranyltransferase [Panus rudis PR-1116 ss-1]|nr:rab-protein geranylgeranyltransferase [Panus rudis PR-1116 ss-1]
MHGVKRVRYSKEALEAQNQRERDRLKEYLALADDVMARRKGGDTSRETFDVTTKLLRFNPEFYTVWNYRRSMMLNAIFPQSSPLEIYNMLSEDLAFTFGLLKQHPKIYWIWNHRRWCLERIPDGPSEEDRNGWRNETWNKELFVDEKMLDADARNFHAWNYRRYILATMPSPPPPMSELKYTTRKIEANFSNFSAWHQRSKVLTTLWEAGELDPVKSREEEFELVRNAMYTDPDDQSVWLYHAWLIGQGNDIDRLNYEIQSIQELLDEQPDSKWCMEALVRYKRMLLDKHSAAIEGKDGLQKLTDECLDLLGKLRDIDPPRKRRYEELDEHSRPSAG